MVIHWLLVLAQADCGPLGRRCGGKYYFALPDGNDIVTIIRKKKFIADPLVDVALAFTRRIVGEAGRVAVDALKRLALPDRDGSGVAGQP